MKKMMVVNPDVLTRQTQLFETPEKTKVLSLDGKMRDILERRDITDEEKVKLYEDALALYTTYRQKALAPFPPPSLPQQPPKPSIPERQFIDDVITSVPRALRGKAEQLTKTVLREMTWSPKGELVVDGQVLPGTHIVDLINDAIRQRKKFRAAGRDTFVEGLTQMNVPRELIGNQELRERLEDDDEPSTLHLNRKFPDEDEAPIPRSPMAGRTRRRDRYASSWLQYNEI